MRKIFNIYLFILTIFLTLSWSNTSKALTISESIDTYDSIKVNLYNYNEKINTYFNKNNLYPGFQQDYGTYKLNNSTTKLNQYSFNFGNVIVKDLLAGKTNITTTGNNIFKTKGITNINQTYYNPITKKQDINHAIFGVMNNRLKNNYPALKDGTTLKDLFIDNGMNGAVKKVNTDNINGLFKNNTSKNGAINYYFDCNSNAAIFNPKTNNFTLYDELITPNFIMYPFGNFLPFSNIETETTKTSLINRNYFTSVSKNALNKKDNAIMINGNQEKSEGYNEYNSLSNSLNRFVELVDNYKKNKNWNSTDLINYYYSTTDRNVPSNINLNNIYNINYDIIKDFLFGLDIEFEFMQPKDGLVGDNEKKDNMIFSFKGDDDVWVYIDDNLFVDLTGIHRQIGSSIDFKDGYVKYYAYSDSAGDVILEDNNKNSELYKKVSFDELLANAGYNKSERNNLLKYKLDENGNKIKAYNSKNYFEATFKDYSKHTLKFYYMERGSGSSMFSLNFNMPVLGNNYIDISKSTEINTEDELLINDIENDEYKFRILKVDSNKNITNELFISPNTEYQVIDNNNAIIETKKVDEKGIIRIKANQTARILNVPENLGKFIVEEIIDSNTAKEYKNIQINGTEIISENYNSTKKFSEIINNEDGSKYFRSNINDISQGSIKFNFENIFETIDTRNLSILKKVEGDSSNKDIEWNFKILLKDENNNDLEKSFNYDGDKSGKIKSGDIIKLKHNETITIKSIPLNTLYEVIEIESNKYGYITQEKNNKGKLEEDTVATFINTKTLNKENINNKSISVKKIWKDNNSKDRPKSITITLYKDNEIYDNQILSQENNWSYTWEKLDSSHSWNIDESYVPKGYEKSISKNNNNFTVTNTSKNINVPSTNDKIIRYFIGLFLSTFIIITIYFIFVKARKNKAYK